TRLAVETAERAAASFAGAIYFVPLADLSDPNLLPGAILDSLRVTRSPVQEPLLQAVDALSRHPTLLVLDNFEHLAEGGVAIVETLLSEVTSLTLLVTSRKLLGLAAEREFVLSPLPVPRGTETAEQLSALRSVQLFIDRAQQVKPDFQVGNATVAAVAALVQGLEGIPLAIELAAARAQTLTPSQMLSQLSHRFDFLASRKRGLGERQRTLWGSMDWSYQLLSPEVRRFFCRLSVFRGGWRVEAAASVCEERDDGGAVSGLARDYLEQLRAYSLVMVQDAASGRFRMLETLREFGSEQM
ncbi:MAG: AfsR/SARP family transcriptional regulator, partial [Armatimonadota bacterium]